MDFDPHAPNEIVLRIKVTKELLIVIDTQRHMYLAQRLPRKTVRMVFIGMCVHEDPKDIKDYIKLLLEGAPLNTHLN